MVVEARGRRRGDGVDDDVDEVVEMLTGVLKEWRTPQGNVAKSQSVRHYF